MENKLSKSEIKLKRKNILSNSKVTTEIRKGDRRIKSSTRFCAVCHRPLSAYVYKDGSTQASENHFHCFFTDLIVLNLCKDIRSCYSTIGKEEED